MLPPIYQILSSDAATSALAGDRIYPHGDAPQDVARPYVTWFLITGVPELELSDTPSTDRCALQIDCWSETSAGADALAIAVRDAIEQHACVTGVVLNGREPETGLYRFAVQVDYWLSR